MRTAHRREAGATERSAQSREFSSDNIERHLEKEVQIDMQEGFTGEGILQDKPPEKAEDFVDVALAGAKQLEKLLMSFEVGVSGLA